MSEKTIRIQQAILPERLKRMITKEQISVLGTKADFSWKDTELEGVVKVIAADEVFIPFFKLGMIEFINKEVSRQPKIESKWNETKATYQLEEGMDIEDTF